MELFNRYSHINHRLSHAVEPRKLYGSTLLATSNIKGAFDIVNTHLLQTDIEILPRFFMFFSICFGSFYVNKR